jgi:hypothetical protein
MFALNKETNRKPILGNLSEPVVSPKSKFVVFGEEMLEKEVRHCGKIGRVYLPPDWVDKQVKIIRID